jgi:hypothetical protein
MRAAGLAGLLCFFGALHAQPSTDEILTEMGFSAAEIRRVLAGEFVTAKLRAVSDRDLSYDVAFLVKTSPATLGEQILEGTRVADDAQVQAYGALSGPGSLDDFAGLRLTSEEARALSIAEPGMAANLSAEEYESFRALRGKTTQAVEEQLRRTLLARYRSYRASGLAGVAPYARGASRVADVTPDLTRAVESMVALQKHLPTLYTMLLEYPRAPAPEVRESFRWVKSIIRDKATYTLAHVLIISDGGARAVVRRTFYVSTGYNAEQSVAGLLPVEGGTVVIYLTHAFTDQVAGSSGALKRSVGSRIMAERMREIFETTRKRIER